VRRCARRRWGNFRIRETCGFWSGAEASALGGDWRSHIILCDVMMPIIKGPAILARLRVTPDTADIPVVFVTTRVQKRELEHFKSLGAVAVITKPFNPMSFAALICALLEARRRSCGVLEVVCTRR
jgi:two-component system, OmpR family, response regulator